jgi:hypothetical protein
MIQYLQIPLRMTKITNTTQNHQYLQIPLRMISTHKYHSRMTSTTNTTQNDQYLQIPEWSVPYKCLH